MVLMGQEEWLPGSQWIEDKPMDEDPLPILVILHSGSLTQLICTPSASANGKVLGIQK
jgi:hypothetical protein